MRTENLPNVHHSRARLHQVFAVSYYSPMMLYCPDLHTVNISRGGDHAYLRRETWENSDVNMSRRMRSVQCKH